MTFSEDSKNIKTIPKHKKPKIMPQMKKPSVNRLQSKLKNIKNDIVEKFKNSMMTQKTLKNQEFKNSKNLVRRPPIKQVKNIQYLKLKNINNDIS